jgi:hypothetical protein
MKRKHSQIGGQFVPLLLDTIDAPAWRAMSHGAKLLYVALRRRVRSDNNGKISCRCETRTGNSVRIKIPSLAGFASYRVLASSS